MTNTPHNTGPSLTWLLWAADAEDACRSISVGGLVADLGMLTGPDGENIPSEPIPEIRQRLVRVPVDHSADE